MPITPEQLAYIVRGYLMAVAWLPRRGFDVESAFYPALNRADKQFHLPTYEEMRAYALEQKDAVACCILFWYGDVCDEPMAVDIASTAMIWAESGDIEPAVALCLYFVEALRSHIMFGPGTMWAQRRIVR